MSQKKYRQKQKMPLQGKCALCVMVSLALYTLGILALAWMVLRGWISEVRSTRWILLWCALSPLLGGRIFSDEKKRSAMVGILISSGAFLVILIIIGHMLGSIQWAGEGTALIISGALGGLLSGSFFAFSSCSSKKGKRIDCNTAQKSRVR